MVEPVDCPEWERYLPEKYICGTCDGRVRPLADCEECGGTGLWLRAIGSARIEELEAALLEQRARYLSPYVGASVAWQMDDIARRALDGEASR